MTYHSDGFTLIELLITLAILSVLMGLVAPLTINQIEKSQDHVELLQFKKRLITLQRQAFFSGNTLDLHLDGKSMTIDDGHSEQTVEFSALFFEPQHLQINSNGIPVQHWLYVDYKHQRLRLDVFQ